ncbi:hypothetical protein FRB90_005592, partial [Tulasnella sp. 427]
APSLHALSCHTHLVLPLSNDYLRYLSITSINLDSIQPPLDRSRLEFRQLVELRITGCNPGAFLAACSTPTLSYTHPQALPHYLHLRELQWDDRGPDPAFLMLLLRCPNLTRFANYIVGREDDVPRSALDNPPTLIQATRNAPSELGKEEALWPRLEEILLDSIIGKEVVELIDTFPSLKRIRVLLDHKTQGARQGWREEDKLLEALRQRLVVIGRK